MSRPVSVSMPQPWISFCIIVKNEQQNLPRCLSSVRSHVDEMIVVDTGSDDNTIEIAQQYGAQVKSFEWCDDFAAARNFAIAQASGNWILTLDADEELLVKSEAWREQLMNSSAESLAYWIPLLDAHQPITALPTIRLFRNLAELQYSGRYHEQITYQNQYIPTNFIQSLSCLEIRHYGYSDALLLHKNLTRNIPLLERLRQQGPLSLLLLLTLGNAYLRTEQIDKARNCWSEAFERLSPHLLLGELPSETVRLPALLFILGLDLLHEQQDYETAMLVCRRGLEWFPDYPPLNHLTGSLMQELGFPLAAATYFEQCLAMGRQGRYFQREPFDLNFLTVWPACDLGYSYMALKRFPESVQAFELALSFQSDYEPAQAGLESAKQQLYQIRL
ncbi:glycosyltransferase family 2 protein [Trichocoleus sp. FACHB-591]|uniref:glycosyltransferase family 2 protein n=1 Tax=Trichocoleus sp. FACHB-591 TaxID=2692872 RepID=UPI0016820717|nr:glycosyltransferase [Trichocoleus sp. FACHB-591]MBD2096294.1 glycosyltransferase family 2 protein [Trichocoleus sp. FACHB-591]